MTASSGVILCVTPGGFVVLERDGGEVPLSRVERAVLMVLARDPSRYWSKAELEEGVWGSVFRAPDDAFRRLDAVVSRMHRTVGCPLVVTGPRRAWNAGEWGKRLSPTVTVVRCEPGATPAQGEA